MEHSPQRASGFDRLRRITRDGLYIPEIDGLRFLAISAVILLHGSEELLDRMNPPVPVQPRYEFLVHGIRNGALGVSFFFVISGMVLALPFAKFHLQGAAPVSLRKYFARRLTRLEPPYILALALYTAELWIAKEGLPSGYLRHAFASLFYQHGLIYGTISPANGVSWSLEIEVQFYLLAPIFMLLFAIRNTAARRTIFLTAILTLSLAQIVLPATGRIPLSLAGNVQYFLAGMLAADYYLTNLPSWKSSYAWDIVALAAIAYAAASTSTARSEAVLPFAFVLLALAAFRARVLQRLLTTPLIAIAGGMCYSLYLLHFSILSATFKLSRHLLVFQDFLLNLLLQLIVFAIPVLVVSTLFFLLIERPCMKPNWPSQCRRWMTHSRRVRASVLDAAE